MNSVRNLIGTATKRFVRKPKATQNDSQNRLNEQ